MVLRKTCARQWSGHRALVALPIHLSTTGVLCPGQGGCGLSLTAVLHGGDLSNSFEPGSNHQWLYFVVLAEGQGGVLGLSRLAPLLHSYCRAFPCLEGGDRLKDQQRTGQSQPSWHH